MYQFFVSPNQIYENEIIIQGDDVNHIKNVLRMSIGEKIILGDGYGKEYVTEIIRFLENEIYCSILTQQHSQAELSSELLLFQGLPKGDKMDTIVQKAVELGATRIVPVRMKRCVVKLDDIKAAKKVKRWQEIAKSAAKQSGRGIIPEVNQVLSYKEAMSMAQQLGYFLIPYECQEGVTASMEQLKQAVKKESIGVLIGPEGGFAPEEIEFANQVGGHPITLGHRILRTETAGMTALSVLMLEIEARQAEGKEE